MDMGEESTKIVGLKRAEKPYKGIRRRKWGKWIAEIREPHKTNRHWLGSYVNAFAAARAYDTASYCLRGLNANLNFPELLDKEELDKIKNLPPTTIKAKAVEVGSKADKINTTLASSSSDHQVKLMIRYHRQIQDYLDELDVEREKMKNRSTSSGVIKNPDLNKQPEPEDVGIIRMDHD